MFADDAGDIGVVHQTVGLVGHIRTQTGPVVHQSGACKGQAHFDLCDRANTGTCASNVLTRGEAVAGGASGNSPADGCRKISMCQTAGDAASLCLRTDFHSRTAHQRAK